MRTESVAATRAATTGRAGDRCETSFRIVSPACVSTLGSLPSAFEPLSVVLRVPSLQSRSQESLRVIRQRDTSDDGSWIHGVPRESGSPRPSAKRRSDDCRIHDVGPKPRLDSSRLRRVAPWRFLGSAASHPPRDPPCSREAPFNAPHRRFATHRRRHGRNRVAVARPTVWKRLTRLSGSRVPPRTSRIDLVPRAASVERRPVRSVPGDRYDRAVVNAWIPAHPCISAGARPASPPPRRRLAAGVRDSRLAIAGWRERHSSRHRFRDPRSPSLAG